MMKFEQNMEMIQRGDHQHQAMLIDDDDREKWVHDSSLDHKGKIPARASTGAWKASLFIITIEFSERMSFFGIASNLITYLTVVLHQNLGAAAKNVNYWTGVTTLMPLLGGYIADTYTGRFTMVLISSIIYLLGLSLMAMSELIPVLKPCTKQTTTTCNNPSRIHILTFFLSMYFLSVGTGGVKPSLESFGADQFDDNNEQERKQKMSYFNWWNSALCCGLLVGVTLIAYMQTHLGWGVSSLVLAVFMGLTVVVFYLGKMWYRYRAPDGSPVMGILQVLVAAWRKRKLEVPVREEMLFESPGTGRLLCHTNRLRFLDKAAILETEQNTTQTPQQQPWRLQTVTKVEETKLIINMIPIWLTSLAFGVNIAQTSTFFIKQAAAMDRKIAHNFTIPPPTIQTFNAIALIISVTLYDKLLVPYLRKSTGNERGLNILQRIGIGLVLQILALSVAASVEQWRRGIGETMSVFWLAPQFAMIGIADAFGLVGLQEYFYDQVPDSMKSLGIAFYLSVIGLGSFLSSGLIMVVESVTGWIGKDLNSSRLDYFCWLLSGLNVVNLCGFAVIARWYSYKIVRGREHGLVDRSVHDGVECVA